MADRAFYTVTESYYQPTKITAKDANAITFLNTGTSKVIFNNCITIQPFGTVEIEGNQDEIDQSQYEITFNPLSGGVNNCVVFSKYYK